MSVAWDTKLANYQNEASETLKLVCDLIYRDQKENGFSKQLCAGYNIVFSAAQYLRTGTPLIGNRTQKFFEEV